MAIYILYSDKTPRTHRELRQRGARFIDFQPLGHCSQHLRLASNGVGSRRSMHISAPLARTSYVALQPSIEANSKGALGCGRLRPITHFAVQFVRRVTVTFFKHRHALFLLIEENSLPLLANSTDIGRLTPSKITSARQVPFRPMLGFQSFDNARVVIGGVELAQKIRKQQFDLRRLGGAQASMADQWSRVLTA